MTTQTLETIPFHDLQKIFKNNWTRKRYNIRDVKEYAYGLLKPEEAFPFSRLLPKTVLEEVLEGNPGSVFADRILDYQDSLNKFDPEVHLEKSMEAEETYARKHCRSLLALVGGR